jgi:hypothetical protein
MAAASSFHGVLRYYDSSRWGLAVTLGLAQWNAAHIGVRFKRATDAEGADVLVVSDQPALDHVGSRNSPGPAAFASRVGIQPGERVTITLGNPPADRLAPSGADVRLVVHELGHVLGLTHDNRPCSVMNSDAPMLSGCRRVGWFVSSGKAMCGPAPQDVRRAARIWRGKPAVFDAYCTAATPLDEGREQTEYVRRNLAYISARALWNADRSNGDRPRG